jgi:hypothetical protein
MVDQRNGKQTLQIKWNEMRSAAPGGWIAKSDCFPNLQSRNLNLSDWPGLNIIETGF